MTPGRTALIGLMRHYLNGLLDPSISLLEVHKLMYFMQEAGENLRLKFTKAPYGPYAENLRHVFNQIEGYYVTGCADGGDQPDKILELLPGAAEAAETFLQAQPATLERFYQISNLVEGFESSFGLELLATTHWVMKHESAQSQEDIEKHIYSWNKRKQQFTPQQIALAAKVVSKM